MNVDKILEAGLLGYCVFCLREIGKEVPLSKVILLDGFLNSFNEVWECLRSQCIKKGSGDADLVLDFSLKHFTNVESSKLFHSIPSNICCEACAGTVQAVGELLKALRTHLKTLVQVILESRRGGKYSRRCEQFEIKLREACVEENVLTETLKLVNSICSSEIQATVKLETIDHDDDVLSDYNEELHKYYDGDSINQDPDFILETRKEEVTIGKQEVYMDVSDPLEHSSSTAVRKKRRKGSGRKLSSKLKYPCPVNDCDKAFQKKSRLNWHQQSCHPETIPPEVPKFPCSCGKAFVFKRYLDLHIKSDLEAHPKPEVQPREPQL